MPKAPSDTKARLRAKIAAIEANYTVAASAADARPVDRPSARTGDPAHSDEKSTLENAAGAGKISLGMVGRDPAYDHEMLDGELGARGEKDGQQAFRKIERLALMREQASASLRTRLKREGFSDQAIDEALGRACACGLVDDTRYADVLIRSRISQGRGAQGIAAELAALGIDITAVRGWPDEFAVDHDSEINRALALLESKPPRAKNKRAAAYRRLMQKGFGASVALTAARLWTESLYD